MNKNYKLILSCCGGGIRGAASITYLRLLEEKLEKPLHDVFDMFIGTSTGAIIALGLGVKKLSALQIEEMFNYENANKIMNKSFLDKILPIEDRPKYDGLGKKEILNKYFGNIRLYDTDKKILITTYDLINRKIKIFKNTKDDINNKKENNIKVSELVDASSAAPTFFPTVNLENGDWLIDGGVVANDPTMCGITEAINLWPDYYKNKNIRVLSVGTGINIRKIDGRESQNYGIIEWYKHGILDIIMDQTTVQYQSEIIMGNNFLFINSPLSEANDDMDDCSNNNINKLKELGKKWFEDYGKKSLELCNSDDIKNNL